VNGERRTENWCRTLIIDMIFGSLFTVHRSLFTVHCSLFTGF